MLSILVLQYNITTFVQYYKSIFHILPAYLVQNIIWNTKIREEEIWRVVLDFHEPYGAVVVHC